MRRLLLLVLLALLFATPGLAAERVLLAPADAVQGTARAASAAPALRGLRQAAAKSGGVRVIIGLRVPFAAEMALPAGDRALQRTEIASAGISLRGRFSAAVARNPGAVRSYSAIPFMTLEVSSAELERLARDPDVISLAPDAMIPLALKESTQLVRAPEAWALGFTGLGQTVAVVDTGVDKTHAFLTGKVVSEACFSQGGSCPGSDPTRSTAPGSGMPCAQADCRHGTHVAGIAAGKGDLYSGVARDASLIAIQVFSPYYSSVAAASSDILAGLNRVYELRDSYKIAAVNLSLGGSRFRSACDATDPAAFAIFANLRAAGIATVVASGNDGFTDSLSWPACYSNAVSVGAVSDEDWGSCYGDGPTAADKVACFSNTASFLSLLAPGASIFSSVPGGNFTSLNGTSMATPHVAGAFAVLRQKFPNESVANLLDRLQNTGRQVSDYRVPAIVKPRIDVVAALGPPSLRLSFVKVGAGSGSVLITAPNLSQSCAASCTVSVAAGSQVTVSAQPATGSLFGAWSGACSGSAGCSFTMQADATLTASFTQQPSYLLSYQKTGAGSGSVSFAPAGGSPTCSTSCIQTYPAGTLVTVTAVPANNMVFTGWSGACSGTGTCQISMSASTTLRASFAPATVTLTYLRLGAGSGSVLITAPNLSQSCADSCTVSVAAGSQVTVSAQPATGSLFGAWSGACSGSAGCSFTMQADATLTASFTQQPSYLLSYEKTGAGSGSVFFAPTGGSPTCSASCIQTYPAGTLVTVTAVPANNMVFTGWSGACSGTGSCQITMQNAAMLAARFAPSSVSLTYDKLGRGRGSVSFSPAGGQASCSAGCVQRYKAGTIVKLVAKPAPNMRFTGWSGACRGTGPCSITMAGPKAVKATFQPR